MLPERTINLWWVMPLLLLGGIVTAVWMSARTPDQHDSPLQPDADIEPHPVSSDTGDHMWI